MPKHDIQAPTTSSINQNANCVAELRKKLLSCTVGANDEQLDYRTIYASGRDGWASTSWPVQNRPDTMNDLLDTIVSSVPKPKVMDDLSRAKRARC
jgi:predicted membrane GTPase involved in stress response